jgi:hypothetical protein
LAGGSFHDIEGTIGVEVGDGDILSPGSEEAIGWAKIADGEDADNVADAVSGEVEKVCEGD